MENLPLCRAGAGSLECAQSNEYYHVKKVTRIREGHFQSFDGLRWRLYARLAYRNGLQSDGKHSSEFGDKPFEVGF